MVVVVVVAVGVVLVVEEVGAVVVVGAVVAVVGAVCHRLFVSAVVGGDYGQGHDQADAGRHQQRDRPLGAAAGMPPLGGGACGPAGGSGWPM